LDKLKKKKGRMESGTEGEVKRRRENKKKEG